MLSESELFDQFSKRAFISGGEVYLRFHDVHEFINACQENDLAIIGVEGFLLKGEKLYPQIDLIADYSLIRPEEWDDYTEGCNSACLSFFDKVKPEDNLLFNFSVLSRSEWEVEHSSDE